MYIVRVILSQRLLAALPPFAADLGESVSECIDRLGHLNAETLAMTLVEIGYLVYTFSFSIIFFSSGVKAGRTSGPFILT